MTTRMCVNKPDIFCYVCGDYTLKPNRNAITPFVERLYHAYFGIKLVDQDKSWAPHMVCKICKEHLIQWSKGTRKSMKFGIPMIWREPSNHATDCYFCAVNIMGYNRKHLRTIPYPNLPSAIRPNPHDEKNPVPVFKDTCPQPSCSSKDGTQNIATTDYVSFPKEDDKKPKLFSQNELNDLVRDLNLPKDSAELLASRLKDKNMLNDEVRISFFRTRHQELTRYFSQEKDLVYCNNIVELLMYLGVTEYKSEDWRLFIDSSKRSMKCVLLHNGNQFASVPLAHSTTLKEQYEAIKFVLEKIFYDQHKWLICVDLKMVNLLLGQQSGFTKYPCFLCLWDSRDRAHHYVKKNWPVREDLALCRAKNMINEPLVDRERILFPPLHIKLGLMKQFTRALNKDGQCFQFLCKTFPNLSYEKLKAGIFDGPQVRQLIKNSPAFEKTMNHVEQEGWKCFVQVVMNFLGNRKAKNYEDLVANMLVAFKNLGCNMSIKVHYLYSHMDRFPQNLGSVSDEQGERFHQDLKEMERRYQGKWDIVMLADYCWSLKRDLQAPTYSRRSRKRTFRPS